MLHLLETKKITYESVKVDRKKSNERRDKVKRGNKSRVEVTNDKK